MAMTPGAAPPRIFDGWWVALALSIIVVLSAGIRFTIGPFLKPVSAELGLSRVVCTAGAIVIAAPLVLTGRMTSLWEFYLYYALIGSLGLGASGHVMGSLTLARWFVRRRGFAMSSLGSASLGVASLVIMPPGRSRCCATTPRAWGSREEPALRARRADAHRPRLPSHDRVLRPRPSSG